MAKTALARLDKCARAAALATETELAWEPDHIYKAKLPNAALT